MNVKKLVTSLIFLSILFGAEPGFAVEPILCVGMRNFTYASIENRNLSNPPLACKDLSDFDDAYGAAQSLFSVPMEKPNISLENQLRGGLESFGAPSMIFMMGFNGASAEEARQTKILFFHEIGHQIFDHYLFSSLPALAKINEAREKSLSFFAEQFIPVLNHCAKGTGPAMVNDLCFRPSLSQLNQSLSAQFSEGTPDKILDLALKDGNYETILRFENPYDELFADVTAAVYFNDPEVIATAVGYLSHMAPLSCRSFIAKPDLTFETTEAHCELSRARHMLWSKWIQPRLADKKILLKDLAIILIAEVNWRMQSDADSDTAIAHLMQSLEAGH